MTSPGSGVDMYDAATVVFDAGAIGAISGAATLPDDDKFQVDLRIFGDEGVLLLDIERERLEVRRHDGRHQRVEVPANEGAYSTAYISLHDSSLVRRTFTFVGAANYVAVWNDINVRQSVGFTIFFTAISVSLQLMLGLGLAELLNRQFLLHSLARAVNLLPWALSAIVVAFAARWIFNTD